MSYFITGSGLITEYTKLDDNTATVVLDEDRTTTVASVVSTETGGSTPNLTIEVFDPDNTVSYYLRNAAAMTAKQTVTYNEPFVVPAGWQVRVTSSNASGQVDVAVNYFNPNATGRDPRQ